MLDEATSQLDGVTERILIGSLQHHWRGKTVIAIAHRLSSLEQADRIVVMEDGRIVQDGAPHRLMDEEGLYSRLLAASRIDPCRQVA